MSKGKTNPSEINRVKASIHRQTSVLEEMCEFLRKLGLGDIVDQNMKAITRFSQSLKTIDNLTDEQSLKAHDKELADCQSVLTKPLFALDEAATHQLLRGLRKSDKVSRKEAFDTALPKFQEKLRAKSVSPTVAGLPQDATSESFDRLNYQGELNRVVQATDNSKRIFSQSNNRPVGRWFQVEETRNRDEFRISLHPEGAYFSTNFSYYMQTQNFLGTEYEGGSSAKSFIVPKSRLNDFQNTCKEFNEEKAVETGNALLALLKDHRAALDKPDLKKKMLEKRYSMPSTRIQILPGENGSFVIGLLEDGNVPFKKEFIKHMVEQNGFTYNERNNSFQVKKQPDVEAIDRVAEFVKCAQAFAQKAKTSEPLPAAAAAAPPPQPDFAMRIAQERSEEKTLRECNQALKSFSPDLSDPPIIRIKRDGSIGVSYINETSLNVFIANIKKALEGTNTAEEIKTNRVIDLTKPLEPNRYEVRLAKEHINGLQKKLDPSYRIHPDRFFDEFKKAVTQQQTGRT